MAKEWHQKSGDTVLNFILFLNQPRCVSWTVPQLSLLYLLEEAAVRSDAAVFVMYVTSELYLKVHWKKKAGSLFYLWPSGKQLWREGPGDSGGLWAHSTPFQQESPTASPWVHQKTTLHNCIKMILFLSGYGSGALGPGLSCLIWKGHGCTAVSKGPQKCWRAWSLWAVGGWESYRCSAWRPEGSG